MSANRNFTTPPPGHRPLTARSVLASALLGQDPPRLPVSQLIRLAEAFNINENRARVALSRMVANAEVRVDNGSYQLISPNLLARQQRLKVGRSGSTKAWKGTWLVAIISPLPATPSRRADRRGQLAQARFGEYRDGVWVRPDNLSPDILGTDILGTDIPGADDVFIVGTHAEADDRPLSFANAADRMWDLCAWTTIANELIDRLAALDPSELQPTDQGKLAACFELSAACLRHFQSDPLLPAELLPEAWPGGTLRACYTTWDISYRNILKPSLRYER